MNIISFHSGHAPELCLTLIARESLAEGKSLSVMYFLGDSKMLIGLFGKLRPMRDD